MIVREPLRVIFFSDSESDSSNCEINSGSLRSAEEFTYHTYHTLRTPAAMVLVQYFARFVADIFKSELIQ